MENGNDRIVNAPPFLPRTYGEAQPSVAQPLSLAQPATVSTVMQSGFIGAQRVVIMRFESVNGSFQFVMPVEQALEMGQQLQQHASGLVIADEFPNGQGGN